MQASAEWAAKAAACVWQGNRAWGSPPVTQLDHPQQTHPRVRSRHLHCLTGSRPSGRTALQTPGAGGPRQPRQSLQQEWRAKAQQQDWIRGPKETGSQAHRVGGCLQPLLSPAAQDIHLRACMSDSTQPSHSQGRHPDQNGLGQHCLRSIPPHRRRCPSK